MSSPAPQNSVALASIQLPPSLFSSLPAALAPPAPPDCTLQLLVFRNGRLFRSHGNTSRPGAVGPGKRRGVATPVIFAGTSKGLNSRYSVGPSAVSALCPFILLFPHPQRPLAPGWRWQRMVALTFSKEDRGHSHPTKKGLVAEKVQEDTGFYMQDLSGSKRAIGTNRQPTQTALYPTSAPRDALLSPRLM